MGRADDGAVGAPDRARARQAAAAHRRLDRRREAVEWGLANETAPAAELDACFEALLERVARLPVNQLVMHKLLVNQTVLAQGLQATQTLGTFFDGIARHTPEGHEFARRAAEAGFRRRSASATSRSAITAGGIHGVRVLITSSRMPFALGMIRQLHEAGHEVFAADDYALSPGSHSSYLAGHFVYPSRAATRRASSARSNGSSASTRST